MSSIVKIRTASNSSYKATIPPSSHIYFRYQSGGIAFEEWVNLVTLCLAPLLTHLAFGCPEPVLLCARGPNWLARLTQYNPITIIWRWYAIVYRRVRARSWDRADMAASNALFWVNGRWDGSEEAMVASRAWATKLPEKAHVHWASLSVLITIAMALQSAGTIDYLLHLNSSWEAPSPALPYIFYSIAVLSILRIPASPWLSSEYGYESRNADQTPTSSRSATLATEEAGSAHNVFAMPEDKHVLLTSMSITSPTSQSRLNPPSALSARIVQTIAILITGLGFGAACWNSVANEGPSAFHIVAPASALAQTAFYFTLCASALCICLFYLVTGGVGRRSCRA